MTSIGNNLQHVQARIADACAAAGRDPASVRLLAVSKTFGPQAVEAALQAGQRAFGENYVQEALDKMAALARWPEAPEWHCIGPLQSNKTRAVAEHFDWVHTVDRLRVAERLSAQRPAALAPLNVCIQVNIDDAPTKAGVPPADAAALAQAVAGLPRLVLRGVMAIPQPQQGFQAQRAVHARTAQLFEALRARWDTLDTLSLGMTDDLEAAIHAGSTLVRVGSGIFGTRQYAAA